MTKFPAAAGPARAKTLKVAATDKTRPHEPGPNGLRGFLRCLWADPCTESLSPRFRARIRQGSWPQVHFSRKRRNGPFNPVAKEKSLKYRAKSTMNPAADGLGSCHATTPGGPMYGVSRAKTAIVSRSGDLIELKKTSTGSLGKVRNRENGLWVYLIASRTDTAHRSFGIRAGRNDSSAKIARRPASGGR